MDAAAAGVAGLGGEEGQHGAGALGFEEFYHAVDPAGDGAEDLLAGVLAAGGDAETGGDGGQLRGQGRVVELAKIYGSDSASRFVNGVLGTLVEHENEIRQAIKNKVEETSFVAEDGGTSE